MVDQGGNQGRNGREKSYFFKPGDNIKKLIDLETGHQDLGSTVQEGIVHNDDVTVDMEKRKHGQEYSPLRGGEIHDSRAPQVTLQGGCHHIGMGQDGPLGNAGCAAGKLDQGRVFRIDLDPYPPGIGTVFYQGREIMPSLLQIQAVRGSWPHALQVVGDLSHNHPGNRNILTEGLDGREGHIKGNQGGNSGITGQGRQFLRGVHGIEVNHDRPQGQSGIIGNGILRAVGQMDSHPISLGNPQGPQGVGHSQDLVPQLIESHLSPEKI